MALNYNTTKEREREGGKWGIQLYLRKLTKGVVERHTN